VVFRRVVHFSLLFIEKYRYGEKVFSSKVKNFHRMVNRPSAFKLSSNSSLTVRNCRAARYCIPGLPCNLGDFSPSQFGYSLENYEIKVKYHKICLYFGKNSTDF
jgi:hypothetical protein